jgi:glycosyltransferase involved in cell wall biosynthesis
MYHACIYASVAGSFMPGTPLLWGIHHSSLEYAGNTLSTLAAVETCRWLSFRKRIHIAYCAESAKRAHEARGYCSERAVFIPNGYDSDKFAGRPGLRDRMRARFNIPGDATVFGLVARFDPIKDHATFLEAAGLTVRKRPGKLAFVLIGDGIDQSNAALMDLIDRNGLRASVVLTGRLDDVAAAYSALDFLALSSRGEAFPNVVCEGMLSELPCIATDVGDCRAIIGDTGFLVPAGSPTELAIAMGSAANLSQSNRRRLGVSARQRIVDRYSVEACLAKYVAVYHQLAGGSSLV